MNECQPKSNLTAPLFLVLPIIALGALCLAHVPQVAKIGLSALPIAILLGIIWGHMPHQIPTQASLNFSKFCQQKLLRGGIILFGFSLNMQQIMTVGWEAVLLDALIITVVFCTGVWLGTRVFKLDYDVAILTAAGSAICGAAAVMATESAIHARKQSVTIAIGTVVLFGTLAMFCYPLIFKISHLSPNAFGIYIGSTVHEVAQAVAAGDGVAQQFVSMGYGADTPILQNAVVVKLIRVMLLAPFIMILSGILMRLKPTHSQKKRITIPWFVFGFLAAAGINSVITLPTVLLNSIQITSQLMLALAMAALGTETRWQTMRQAGVKPLVLAFILFMILMLGGYGLNVCLIRG